MSDISAGDDSIEVMIQKPKEDQDKLKAAFSWQLNQDSSDTRGHIYLAFNVIYLRNLMDKKSEQKQVPKHVRQYVPNDCIFFTQFQIQEQSLKGNVQLLFTQYKGLTLRVKFVNKQIPYTSGWCQIHYKDNSEWKSRGIRPERLINKHENGTNGHTSTRKKKSDQVEFLNEFQLLIRPAQVTQYTKQFFLLDINFYKVFQQAQTDFIGIENIGNTCYFNSFIQILYFIRPFRKIILQNNKKNQLLQSLQQLFCEMTCKEFIRSADSTNVMKCFPHYKQYNPQQQDIQQFMMNFFEDLQKDVSEVENFWLGYGTYITQSKDKTIGYRSVQQDIFNQLDLHFDDHKGNRFSNIHQSLSYLLAQQKVDELLDTDEFGKIQIVKRRIIRQLPAVLFLNLKRYAYDQKRRSLSKVLSEMAYPQTLNLGFLMGTPKDNEEESLEYSLLAVTVHKGRSPYHGHYYSFINTSEKLDKSKWYKFNDSTVEPAQIQKILQKYQGQKEKVIQINKKYGRWEEMEYDSDQTAYLLVYLRNQVFEEYQKTKCKIPPNILQKHKKKHKELQQEKTVQIRILVLDQCKQSSFDPFSDDMEYNNVPLNKDEDILAQLKAMQDTFLCTIIGTVWKVNTIKKTIKYCGKRYGPKYVLNADRIGICRIGHSLPDYLLIVPSEMSEKHVEKPENTSELVMIQINQKDGKRFQIIHRSFIDQFFENLKKQNNCEIKLNDQGDKFFTKWNDFCVVDLI